MDRIVDIATPPARASWQPRTLLMSGGEKGSTSGEMERKSGARAANNTAGLTSGDQMTS